MLKRKLDKALEDWKANRKQALLVTGARQIGKTYSITNFIKKSFKHQIIINFAYRTDLIDLFCSFDRSDDLLFNLSAVAGSELHKHETIIFFDEIQLLYKRRDELKRLGRLKSTSQDLLTAIKKVVEGGEYRFILSGSLLGATISNILLSPVGYLDILTMYPIDFEEYLWNKGVKEEVIAKLECCFSKKEAVDENINQLFLNYFKEYVLIGGMPEAVNAFLETKNLYSVQVSQEQINKLYELDMTTYVEDKATQLRVKEIYEAIPSELNSKNKRFMTSHVFKQSILKREDVQGDFLWLSKAGIAIPVYNVTEPSLPLALSSNRKTMKLFLNDIGLLDSMLLSTGVREKMLIGEKVINYGAPYENVVAQELAAHGYSDKLFYYNSKTHGEIDFLIEHGDDVLPIEIKSGKPNQMSIYNHTALNNLLKTYSIRKAFVFGMGNVIKETDRITQFPIYMISFIKRFADNGK